MKTARLFEEQSKRPSCGFISPLSGLEPLTCTKNIIGWSCKYLNGGGLLCKGVQGRAERVNYHGHFNTVSASYCRLVHRHFHLSWYKDKAVFIFKVHLKWKYFNLLDHTKNTFLCVIMLKSDYSLAVKPQVTWNYIVYEPFSINVMDLQLSVGL